MPSSARLLCVDPCEMEKAWQVAEPMIRRAIERTGLSDMADVESALFCGAYLLWLARVDDQIKGIAVTQLVTTSAGKACIVVACAGRDRDEWLPLIDGIEDFARAEGCRTIRLYGRRGWQRVLRDYRAKYAIMDKELN